GDFAEKLFAAWIRAARAKAGVHAGNPGAGDSDGSAAVFVWRSDRPVDSAVRGGGVSGVHAFAGRDGAALVEVAGAALEKIRDGEWIRGVRDRHNGGGGAGGEVCGRSVA